MFSCFLALFIISVPIFFVWIWEPVEYKPKQKIHNPDEVLVYVPSWNNFKYWEEYDRKRKKEMQDAGMSF